MQANCDTRRNHWLLRHRGSHEYWLYVSIPAGRFTRAPVCSHTINGGNLDYIAGIFRGSHSHWTLFFKQEATELAK